MYLFCVSLQGVQALEQFLGISGNYINCRYTILLYKPSYARCEAPRIFLARYEISETNYRRTRQIISIVCLSMAQFSVRLFETTIRAGDLRFAAKCRHQLPLEVLYFGFLKSEIKDFQRKLMPTFCCKPQVASFYSSLKQPYRKLCHRQTEFGL